MDKEQVHFEKITWDNDSKIIKQRMTKEIST